MKPPSRFSGIWVPLVTPFQALAHASSEAGPVDLATAQRLARFYADEGVAGLVVCGTTGEPATLSVSEQHALLSAVLEAVQGRCPVMMGAAGNHTDALAQRLRLLDSFDLAGVLISPPAYVKPSQAGIIAHYLKLADATRHPIVLYNIPSRTGVNMEPITVAKLVATGRFPAIKESAGNVPQLLNLLEIPQLDVLCGDDILLLTSLLLGARGGISATAHIRPDLFVALYHQVEQGHTAAAQSLFQQLKPLIEAMFSEPNPAPLKAALAQQGWLLETLRLPMTPVSEACNQQLALQLERVMKLERGGPAALAA
jgi:4-hydroxy-tetrahydrodipicolinate synthase